MKDPVVSLLTGFLTFAIENETVVPAGLELVEYPLMMVRLDVVADQIKDELIPVIEVQELAEVAGVGRVISEGNSTSIFASWTIS